MENKQCFAFKHSDEEVRCKSTSGGAFSAIALEVVRKHGSVYGAALNTADMTVSHIRVDTIEEIGRLRGSKYVQSVIGDVYFQVYEDLLEEKTVFFSGTPCQVAGLRSFLHKDYENLFTCDIICHGVCSPLIWKEFINFIEYIHKKKVASACFRDKEDYQWEDCKETLFVHDTNTETMVKVSADDYAKIFYDHEAMRPSCYNCLYTTINRPGDITLGDFWGVEKAHPELYDEKGVSFVMKNTEKGDVLVQMLSANGVLKSAALNETRQPQLYKPVRKPSTREWFWKIYKNKGFDAIIYNNRNSNSMINVHRKLVSNLKSIFKILIQKNK